MTEYITYNSSYTEFLIPGYNNLKVWVSATGIVYIDDMATNKVLVTVDNENSGEVYDLKEEVEELKEQLSEAQSVLAFWKECSGLWKKMADRKIKEFNKLNEAYLKEVDRTDRLAKWLNGDDAWLYKIANIIDAWSYEAESDDRIEQ